MSEIARHQLLITLVHGTWGRGFFPRRQRQNRRWTTMERIERLGDRLVGRIERLGDPLGVRDAVDRVLQRREPYAPLWFEEGSPFLARLSTELGDIPHKITPLLWSGANSIVARNKTAHVLAEYLSAEHAEHPQASQLVIAHSHGGNIALRALYLLRKRDASRLCGAEMPTPHVVTLATPFVESVFSP